MIPEMLKAKSVHIFAFPYQCRSKSHKNTAASINSGFDKYCSVIETVKDGNGKPVWHRVNGLGKDDVFEQADHYMLWKYLNVSAHEIYSDLKPEMLEMESGHGSLSDTSCRIYRTEGSDISENSKYSIYAKGKEKPYVLYISRCELHVYSFGCAILFLYCLNLKYADIKDIKIISDYGRRIELPFLPLNEDYRHIDPDGFILPAQKLELTLNGCEYASMDFHGLLERYAQNQMQTQTGDTGFSQYAPFLDQLINIPDRGIIIEKTEDDRMFEILLLRDNGLSRKLEHKKKGSEDSAWETDQKFQEELYSILFIDPTDPSCQNRKMRRRLLEQAIDPRWSEYGTIHAVTSFSMVCITSEEPDINDSVVRPMLLEYPVLFSLVVAQRIGLLRFTEMAGSIAAEFENKKSHTRQTKQLSRLQENYVRFKNQIMLPEITMQDQGIGLYGLLQKQIMIQRDHEIVDGQLEQLYEAVNVNVGNHLERVGIVLAVIAIAVDVILNPTSVKEFAAFLKSLLECIPFG